MGTNVFLGVKRPGREPDQSPPSSTELKSEWSYTSAVPVCHGVEDNFAFSTHTTYNRCLKGAASPFILCGPHRSYFRLRHAILESVIGVLIYLLVILFYFSSKKRFTCRRF